MAVNTGWVKVGVDHETAAFAGGVYPPLAEAAGAGAYPGARQLLIRIWISDSGG